ncbi:MAG: GNAT family N-acetyltransferase [Chitinophagaceae bacterium]|jgi:GNAT superfamily N-acetyltransferase|nr:GNAT family N-acetyltransferase [Chitinophagaceae bacterium]MCA6486733.1 GNAT family N-acetyltransferase [Chitinophagaceae bacterium]
MALKIIDHGTSDYRQMVELRLHLLRKPLGLSFTAEELEKEKSDILLGCFEEDKLEACCILTEVDPSTVRLRQMAVGAALQRKGIGRVLMNFAENIARDRKYTRLTMHARKSAVGFYEKSGYRICSDEFTEVTIPHFEMEKEL